MNSHSRVSGDAEVHCIEGKSERLRITDKADPGQDVFGAWWQSFLRGGKLESSRGGRKLTAVDLFCGAGGLAVGLDLAARACDRRLEIVAAVDADRGALEVYAANNPVRSVYNESVTALVDYRVRRRDGSASFAYQPEIVHDGFRKAEGCDVVVAGPPCQGHSNLNNHTRRNDPRDDLFVAAAASAVALQAKAAVIENVPSVTRSHGEVVRIARELFLQSGYVVEEGVLKADRIGGAQRRARYFMIAVRRDELRKGAEWLDLARLSERNQREARSAWWAIGDIERYVGDSILDTPGNVGRTNQDRIDWLFDNGAYDLPNEHRPDCHKSGTTYTAVYGRMDAERPAPTVTTGFGTPGQGRYIHPTQRRLITPREAARLQGFPSSYDFLPEGREPLRREVTKWIGDAVPAILGMYVGVLVQELIFGESAVFPWDENSDCRGTDELRVGELED